MLRRWRWGAVGLCLLVGTMGQSGGSGSAAAMFASPAFDAQWRANESLTPNFWGPLANARDGATEPYREATGGMRLVQYFDKGRMELGAGGTVTSGLLATEMIRGQIQTGDGTFDPRAAPAIAMAGDGDNAAPTYGQLGASALVNATPARMGGFVTVGVQPNGTFEDGGGFAGISMTPPVTAYDMPTRHNVLGVFADFRARVGLAVVGYAIAEPFRANVRVGGTSRTVFVQAFERRVLTYTATNPDAFKVEFGNIGQHYAQWRYPGGGLPLGAVSPGMQVFRATQTAMAARATPPAPQTTAAPAAAPNATIVGNLLPAGFAVESIKAVDLGANGETQAIFTATGSDGGPGRIETAGLLVRRGGAWVLDFATPTDNSGAASVEAFPKNGNRPGFALFAFHYCGANCNGGFHTVVRYDGGGMTTVVLNGADDRGNPTADAATGKVTLNAPLYRANDPRCCPAYAYTQTWTWRGTELLRDGLTLRASDSEVGQPLPEWLRSGGVPLFNFLGPLQALNPETNRVAALFRGPVPIRDAAGRTCSVGAAALAAELPNLLLPGNIYLWPIGNGSSFRASLTLQTRDDSGTPVMTTVGSCVLGGTGVGGYVLTIEGQQNGFLVTALQAVDEVYKTIPDTAVIVPAVV